MGIRIMVSPNRIQGSHFLPQARQGTTLYNLTFDEAQTQLGNVGKPLNSMNLDELMKNVISPEGHQDDHQLMQNPVSSSSFVPSSFFVGNDNGTLLSKKTVDEVWKEIVLQEHEHDEPVNGTSAGGTQSVQQQLGETTLEDFLLRAGLVHVGNQEDVINPQPVLEMDSMVAMSQQADWLQLQMAAAIEQQQQMTTLHSNFHVSETVFENSVNIINANFPENQLALSTPMLAAVSSDSQSVSVEKKRQFPEEVMEKTMERRQKRMIKNRESAARSRARKQAYTNQLEHEVLELRKTNSWLKKLKEAERGLSSNPAPVPRYQLRRTSSAPF